jgi:hypothetical protein
MSGYTNVLDPKAFDNESEPDEKTIDNDEKNEINKSEGKATDITQQQWFWDQAVMS